MKTRQLTGRHVAFALLGLFGTVFAVNGVFAYVAVSGFPGLETASAYRKGLNFNHRIAGAERLRALGWQMSLEQDTSRQILLRFRDADGAPLDVSGVRALLAHPTTAKADLELAVRPIAPGSVAATLGSGLQGQRRLRVSARGPDGRPIEFRRPLWIN